MEMTRTEYFDDSHNCPAVEYRTEHAFIKIDFLDEDESDGYVDYIEVEEGCRGQGIGTALIREVMKDFYKLYFAPTDENNARLYARLGEQVVGDDVTTGVPYECLYYFDQGFGIYKVA